jgi:hypothetical protein
VLLSIKVGEFERVVFYDDSECEEALSRIEQSLGIPWLVDSFVHRAEARPLPYLSFTHLN